MDVVKRKLTTIIAADVVGFSKMMGANENRTLDNLKRCRAIIDNSIAEHSGRIFGAAGDSVIAEFASPVTAVLCAHEFQKILTERNEQAGIDDRMQFRVGVNFGDVIIDGDNLYGDGVNVAARLESESEPGGVCISAKVFDEVRRKLDLAFIDGGVRQLKNIDEPVPVFHLRHGSTVGGDAAASLRPTPEPASGGKPTVVVAPFKAIGQDADAEDLAIGLREDVIGGLARQSALSVVQVDDGAEADFVLEGSVRAAAQRLRLSFTMLDTKKRTQVWSERYDRTKDDLFDLEDEVSQSVISVIRIRLKALEFERLRDTANDSLSVPDLLSKAAGYFVRSPGDNEAVAGILSLALERAPGNSMAHAMTAFCRFREYEFSPIDMPSEVKDLIAEHLRQALVADESSFYARLIAALHAQDIEADFPNAMVHAETALEINPNFTQGSAMLAILNCHLGDPADHLERLQVAIAANKEDPQRFRHQRELVVALCLAGRFDEAIVAARRMAEIAPDMCRNSLVAIAAMQWAGRPDDARGYVAQILSRYPDLTLVNMRPVRFHDPARSAQFVNALREAGIPEG